MRKIMRRIAHIKMAKAMAKAGLKHVNKRGLGGESYFSRYWRQWV